MALATLSIDLEAKLANLERDLGKASRLVEKQARETERNYAELTGNAKKLGVAIGEAFAVGVVVDFAKRTVDAIDALNDVRDATGASIENISALEDTALRTGASLEDVSGLLIKFNGALKEADGKNGVSQALKAIGLDAAELRKLDPAEALTETAQALAGFADDGTKARIVQELFGKSIKDAAPFLNDLAESGLKNKTVTAEQAAEAEKFNKQLFQLHKNFTDVSRSIVSDMLPALNKLFDKGRDEGFLALFGFDKKFFDTQELAKYAKALTDAQGELERFTGLEGQWRKRLQTSNQFELDQANAQARFDAAKKAFKEAYARLKEPARVEPVKEPAKVSLPELPAAKADDKRPAAAKVSEAERYLEALQKQLQSTEKLTEVEKVLDDIQHRRIDGIKAASAGSILDAAAQIDALKEQEQSYKAVIDELDRTAEAHARDRDEAQRYFDASLTGAERLQAELKKVNDLYAKGAFGEANSPEADAKLAKVTASVKEKLKDIDGAGSKLATSLRDNLSDTFFDVMDGKLDNLGDRFKQVVLRMAADAAAARLTEALFGSTPGKSGTSAGSAAGDVLSAIFGKIVGYANGGDPPVGKASWVGERGPELFVPKRAGTIIPNHLLGRQSASSSSVIEIHQQISVGDGVSRSEMQSAMVLAKNQAKAEILQSMRNKGAYDQ